MLMADGGSNYCEKIDEDDEYEEFSSEDLYIEIDALLNMLDESSDELQSNQEDLSSSKNVLQGDSTFDVGSHESSRLHDSSQVLEPALPVRGELNCQFPSTCNAEASDSRPENVSALLDSSENSLVVLDSGNPEFSAQTSSPVPTSSTSLQDWSSQIPRNETSSPEDITVSQFEKHNGHTSSSFSEAGPIHISEGGENLYSIAKGETEAWTRHVSGDNDFKYYSHISLNDRVEVNLRNCGTLGESSIETLGPSENNSCPSAAISFRDPDLSMQNATSTESTICQSSEVLSNFDDHYSAMQYCLGSDDVVFPDPSEFYFPRGDYRSQVVASNGEMMNVMKDEVAELPSNNISSDGRMDWYIQQGTTDKSVSMMSMTDDYLDASRWKYNCEGDNYVSLINDSPLCHANDYHMDDKASMKLSMGTQPYFASKQEMGNMKIDRNDELNKSSSVRYHSIRVGRSFNSKLCIGNDRFLNNKLKPSYSAISPPISNQNHEFVQHEEEEMFSASGDYYSQDMGYAIDRKSCTDDGHLNFNVLDEHLCYTQPSTLNKRLLVVELDEQGGKMTHTNLSDNSHFEDEPDICIIENMSHPAPLNRTLVVANSVVASQSSQISDSKNLVGVGSMRHKAKDEQLILSAALQDLSQPKSEASPPDGALAVSLLRHQKIALSWMVQKETTSLHCCGGILADDQGLGKTISTIALILKERPPCFQPTQDVQHGELMTLNLDDDEDMHQVTSSSSTKSTNISVQSKGRPAAGTLVVCPTSVLRQWAEELHNKVTSTANLSVLVYHGSNRTKDPRELAKYDVVITTYSIVSMEVPKQSLGDEDDDERGKAEDRVGSTWELSSSKKRKFFSSSSKKYSKGKRKVDNTLLESVARPLAKVGWFRVVLDEAQSIKNHRTHVARACWGLRAKRRWCLSGTPIQNAIDDLYSYFRFLRYDPYASYKSFCSSIKVPINRNPSKGYKKLQAVLQTIMLRRTKGTLLDGQPIINLPSKVVELKKVEFTDEERDFYLKLEADSKAQFEEYAAAGTVKQNYVNILLMLLRLRQACDHPLLVRPYNSNSLWRSSAEVAKKLPWDKQIFLRNRLEASLAICGICNDVPEDAVVSECGHVFCKQCICEHLSGDDRQCPSRHCKVQLHISSIFSRSTLDCSLSEQSSLDGSPNCSGSEVGDPTEQFSEDRLYSSSKIKAALEVLQSLSKPRNDTSIDNSVQKDSEGIPSCAEKSSCIQPTEPVKATTECQNLIMDESSSNSDSGGGEKAIVFSQWTRMLDLLEACLKNTSIQYRRLDGTMSVAARDTAVKDFNTLPEVTVVIMSLKAASLGLNMVAACHVLLLDLWWNPTTEDQAIDRAHRIGQTRTVKVLRLTVKETIEDRILDLQRKKREMVSSAFGEDESGGRQTRLTVEDLKYLFMM